MTTSRQVHNYAANVKPEAYIDGKIGTCLLNTGLWIASDVAYVNHCETGDLDTKD